MFSHSSKESLFNQEGMFTLEILLTFSNAACFMAKFALAYTSVVAISTCPKMSRIYRPTILTINQPFSKWSDVFGDTVIANAIIDRLVHHCDIVKITGRSYRIKGRNIFDDTND